jgi:DNA-nicking Smr family endonuclease
MVENPQLVWLRNNNIFDKDAAAEPVRNVHVKKYKGKKKRNIQQKEIAVDSEIDLHEFGLEEALCKVELELELAKKNKWKSIRIVHGVGEKSGGIIRKMLERKFNSEWSSKVSEYRSEKNNRGSSLAVLAQ